MSNVKPCPFCGSKCEVVTYREFIPFSRVVECVNMECQYRSGFRMDKADAILAHNKLSDAQAPEAAHE